MTHSIMPSENPGKRLAIDAMIQHLQHESKYLDLVIENCRSMKTLLQKQNTATSDAEPEIEAPSASIRQQLAELKDNLSKQFGSVLQGRQQMLAGLRHFETPPGETLSLSDVASQVHEPARSQLKNLRCEIKAKLSEFQAITLSNQAVLIYTMDFYQRILTGMTGNIPPSKSYNAHGKLTRQSSSPMIQTNC